MGNRQIARMISADEKLVRHRLRRMAQHALLEHFHRTQDLQITEPISYDGVENFARSQYEPNNINQAIGWESQFIYDFNFAPLNRKGRMSPRQKLRKEEIERSEGKFPSDAIRRSSVEIFARLVKRTPERGLDLFTDEHFQYRRALERDLRDTRIHHTTVSAKAPRVYLHILFPVNHTDLLLRHHVKPFMRETIAFSKTHGAMIQKYVLLMVWKNYMRVQFTKRHRRNPRSNTQTPAMAVGIAAAPLSFGEFFGTTRVPTQTEAMCAEWALFYAGKHPYPRK
jgi:hypothetical protein